MHARSRRTDKTHWMIFMHATQGHVDVFLSCHELKSAWKRWEECKWHLRVIQAKLFYLLKPKLSTYTFDTPSAQITHN